MECGHIIFHSSDIPGLFDPFSNWLSDHSITVSWWDSSARTRSSRAHQSWMSLSFGVSTLRLIEGVVGNRSRVRALNVLEKSSASSWLWEVLFDVSPTGNVTIRLTAVPDESNTNSGSEKVNQATSEPGPANLVCVMLYYSYHKQPPQASCPCLPRGEEDWLSYFADAESGYL